LASKSQSAPVSVRIDGLKELAAALRELPRAVGAKRLRKPVAQAAAIIKDSAQARAPIAEARGLGNRGGLSAGQPPPGTLRKSIIVKRVQGSALDATYIVAVRHGKRYRDVGKLHRNLDAYYWSFLEFGTAKMSARPFMRPAYESNKDRALQTILYGLAEGVHAEASALGAARPHA
jgi:HK97 gp10 family phage protein